jgi:hypothetical protein
MSAPDDRPEAEDRADGDSLEPWDGDTGWERDRWSHADDATDYGQGEKA